MLYTFVVELSIRNNNKDNNSNDYSNSNDENFIILKQYYMYNYTPLYLKVMHNWLVC